ncbi:MAG: hypothetical protein H6557_27970 [Lewinellaceae bacterium]|nr:hypothetical protein [Phaeodactylibacter sp.]MCB9040481.1 hypothetical protein [Lewinellaceae bacterium]
MKCYPLFFILLFASACSSAKRAEKAFGGSIFQHWVHAHEEDQPEYRAFRPAGYELPLSRGREGFDIRRDGSFMHYPIGAADVPGEAPAKWALKNKAILVVTPDDPARPSFELRILEAGKDLLKIAK